jgi:uncharacterized protein with ACT and thioredoxin-like domain
MAAHAILTTVSERPGMLYAVSKSPRGPRSRRQVRRPHQGDPHSEIYFEFTMGEETADALLADLRAVPGVARAEETPTFGKIFGKRIIVMGGGAQVARRKHQQPPDVDGMTVMRLRVRRGA